MLASARTGREGVLRAQTAAPSAVRPSAWQGWRMQCFAVHRQKVTCEIQQRYAAAGLHCNCRKPAESGPGHERQQQHWHWKQPAGTQGSAQLGHAPRAPTPRQARHGWRPRPCHLRRQDSGCPHQKAQTARALERWQARLRPPPVAGGGCDAPPQPPRLRAPSRAGPLATRGGHPPFRRLRQRRGRRAHRCAPAAQGAAVMARCSGHACAACARD